MSIDLKSESTKSNSYSFEYSDTPYSVKLLLVSIATFIGLLCAMPIFIDTIGGTPGIIIVFVIPFLIFWFNKKKIKKYGTATINEKFITLDLNKQNHKIEFDNIKSYLVQHYNGVYLRIIQNDGKKTTVTSNSNFCNSEGFELFCEEFETTIEKSRIENKLPIIRKKSFFEKKWVFVFLIIMTIFFIGAIFKGMLSDRKSYASLFTSLGTLIALWGGYFSTKIKVKNRID